VAAEEEEEAEICMLNKTGGRQISAVMAEPSHRLCAGSMGFNTLVPLVSNSVLHSSSSTFSIMPVW
jgi:hypothetical protein